MIALLGKSGSGKNTVLNELVQMGYKRVVSYTTRPIRDGEKDGVDYHFVSNELFSEMSCQGEFTGISSFKTVFGEWHYGLPTVELFTQDAAAIVNPFQYMKICCFPSVTSFLIDVSDDVRKRRLKARGDNNSEINRRMTEDEKDFSGISDKVDFVILNNEGRFSPKFIAAAISNAYKRR